MFKSASTSLIVRGVIALAVGAIALAWPGVTVLALVITFAVYAFAESFVQLVTAFNSDGARPVVGHLLLGLVDIAAGVIALAWPAATALVLVMLVASWAVVTGIIEVVTGLRSGQSAGTRTVYILGGLISTAFGVVLFARPDMGALTLALLFGWFSVMIGTWELVQGIQLHSADKKVKALAQPTRTAVTV
jgi:uncharacterized membrane protein HdeD (DUF308 family)